MVCFFAIWSVDRSVPIPQAKNSPQPVRRLHGIRHRQPPVTAPETAKQRGCGRIGSPGNRPEGPNCDDFVTKNFFVGADFFGLRAAKSPAERSAVGGPGGDIAGMGTVPTREARSGDRGGPGSRRRRTDRALSSGRKSRFVSGFCPTSGLSPPEGGVPFGHTTHREPDEGPLGEPKIPRKRSLISPGRPASSFGFHPNLP